MPRVVIPVSDHSHREFVEGCFRCDLSRDEVRRGDLDEMERLVRRLRDRGFPKLAPVVRSDLVLRAADAIDALVARVREAEAERDEGWRVAAEQTRLERARAERAEAVIAEVERNLRGREYANDFEDARVIFDGIADALSRHEKGADDAV